MARRHGELPRLPEEPWDWEEISLDLLRRPSVHLGTPLSVNHASVGPISPSICPLHPAFPFPLMILCRFDFDFLAEKSSGRKRQRLKWMVKPRAIPQLILKLLEPQHRESALRMLSLYLYEKREEEPEKYYTIALLLYNSFGTMSLLIQELIAVYVMFILGNLTERAAMRLINVIILFQCIAANKLTRKAIVNFQMVNLLVPLVMHQSPLRVYANVRAVALSVIGIICQDREPEMLEWALESNILDVCSFSIETGNELTKVVGLHILESFLKAQSGRLWLLTESNNIQCDKLLKALETPVIIMAAYGSCLPRLLFHIIRCYILFCNEPRGYDLVKEALPHPFIDGDFCKILESHYPVVWKLLRQLLLIVGKQAASVHCYHKPLAVARVSHINGIS